MLRDISWVVLQDNQDGGKRLRFMKSSGGDDGGNWYSDGREEV